MKTAATKGESASNARSTKHFFSKRSEGTFFPSTQEVKSPFFSPLTIQPKLTVNQPNDKYEQEADLMADRVARKIDSSQSTPQIQRQEEGAEEEEEVQMKAQSEGEMEVMRKAISEGDRSTGLGTEGLKRKLDATKGSGGALSEGTRSLMEPVFGVDFSGVRVHTDSSAVQMSQDLSARAFTHGSDIYFNKGTYNPNSKEGKKLLAHELTHVVQQNHGIKRSKIQRKKDINSQQSATPVFQRVNPSSSVIQRYVFIKEKQTKLASIKSGLTQNMTVMITDKEIRNYKDMSEFKKHASGGTDYLGNLDKYNAGTWVRFNKTGLNILGESHIETTLQDVLPVIGSTNFVRERLASDDFSKLPQTKSAYEKENKAVFKQMGIDGKANKQKYGGESIFPKLGYAMASGLSYFKQVSGYPITDLESPPPKTRYFGRPLQRYLKIAWGYAKDVSDEVKRKRAAKEHVAAGEAKLAAAYKKHKSVLDPFISPLKVEGYLGDNLKGAAAQKKYLPPLAEVAEGLISALLEMASTSAVLDAGAKKQLGDAQKSSATTAEQEQFFSTWRNLYFKEITDNAAKSGVRYAGMGLFHLQYLVKEGLPSGSKGFDMTDAGTEMKGFKSLTEKLKKKAK